MSVNDPLADEGCMTVEVTPHDGTVLLRELLAQPSLHVDTLTPIRDLDRPI